MSIKSAKNILTNNLSQYIVSDEQLQFLKNAELSIFDDVYNACKKRHIPFYLMHGTMLGAVRHKGFIPWDDDIDTAAHLEDLEKIKIAIKEDYPQKYDFAGIFEDYNTNPFYGLKVMLKDSQAVEMSSENFPNPKGIFIDVFPIFKTSPKLKTRNKLYKKIKLCMHIGALTFEYRYPPTTLLNMKNKVGKYYRRRRLIGRFLSPFYKLSRKKILKIYHLYDNKNSDYYAINIAIGLKNKYSITKDILNETREYEFEGRKYVSLANYDYLLKAQYGENYMSLPPLEKRERHMMLKIIF